MPQNKIIFSSYCEDHLVERFGLKKLLNSFNFFHYPEYKMVLYGSEDLKRIQKEYNVSFSQSLPCIMLDAKRKNNADFTCHIDADSLVLGKLDKILEMDYEVASVRCDGDHATGDESANRPNLIKNLPRHLYVTPGCISTNSEKFLLEWKGLNDQIFERFGGVKLFWQADINMMNILFHLGNYKTKILDSKGSDVFYGSSANMPSPNQHDIPEHIMKEWRVSNWQSWKDIIYKDGEFWLYGKVVKLLHNAAGGSPKTAIKLHFSMFNPETRKKIQEITDFNE